MAVASGDALYLRFLHLGSSPEVAVEDNRLKHRLVGATVLVALGVVFFPLWLDMHPAPGTRLEKTNIPPSPLFNFFNSEKEENQSITPPSLTVTEPPPVTEAPPLAPVSKISVPDQPLVAVAAPPPPLQPPPPPSRAGILATEIKSGDSINGLFAKAGLGTDQVRALLKLGLPVKMLEAPQSGRNLWIKTGPKKELQELIYHGPKNQIYAHVIRRGGSLQLADAASAARALGIKMPKPEAVPREETVPRLSIVPVAPVAPVLPPVVRKPSTTRPIPPVDSASAWVVQIASLNREENARALRDNLRSKNFPAFLESLYDGPTNKRWRVRVGPSTDRSEINAMRTRLERDAHLSGQVLPYP